MTEIKKGCASLISVVCHKCGRKNEICTSRQHHSGKRGPGAYDINTRVALGAIDSGIGYTHINSLFTALNVPTINRSAYKRREREIGLAIEEVAASSCRMALENEIDIEKSLGKTPDPDGLVPLSISYDMQWLKRGRANDSLTGHGAIMGSKTKKVLDYSCANKLCRICESARSKGKEPAHHDCRQNHKGSSKSMEPEVGVRLFNDAPNHGVKYSVFIGDDDSSTIAKIREEVAYSVEKWSDSTHATRTLVSHLHKIRSEKNNFPGESVLSQKVIDYLQKCFSYCLSQNKGIQKNMRNSLVAIVPHAFGDHKKCKENKLNWCKWLQNPDTFFHNDLPNGKDLKGENLRENLTNLFQVYSSDTVINKLVENASSQSNESLHSTVGSKVPKIRFYGGSESADQRIAAAVAQTNIGKQYLLDTLHCVDIEPGQITEQKIALIDYEREATQKRKSSIEFKKQRRLNYLKRKSRNKAESNREGISYETGIALTLDPELLQRAVVTQQELKQFEKYVPTFSERPPKKYIACPVDENSGSGFGFVVFDTETSCGGKEAELIQLAAETKQGASFSRFTIPTKEISPYASRVNKFKTTWVGGKKILHRGGNPLQTVPLFDCVLSFVDFLEDSKRSNSCDKIVLIGHNSATFDTPILLRTLQNYSPELLQRMNKLNVHFADSLVLFRNLIKDKHEALKQDDDSFVKTNQGSLYKHLFGTDFQCHDALEDVKALNRILFKSSLHLSTSTIVNKSGTTELSSAIEEMNYLDKSHALLKSFDGVISDSSQGGVMKKSIAKKLADSGIGYHHLKQLFETKGEQGLLAILANPPSNSRSHRVRGTADPLTLHLILSHFKGIQS